MLSSGEHFHCLNRAHLPMLSGPSYASSLFVWHSGFLECLPDSSLSVCLNVFPPIHFFFLACMFSLRETSPVSSRFSFLYILHEPSHPMCPEGSECKRTEQPWEHPVGSLACLARFCLDENALDFLLCLFFFNVPCLLSVLVHSVFKRACKYCTLLQNLLTRYPSLSSTLQE